MREPTVDLSHKVRNARIRSGVAKLREMANGAYVDLSDWDALLDFLLVELCDHEWRIKSMPSLADPAELVRMNECERCGVIEPGISDYVATVAEKANHAAILETVI